MSNDKRGKCSDRRVELGVSFVGHFRDGRPVGRVWRGLPGGTWVTGRVDQEGELTGEDVAFVYQDLKTAVVGRFKDGILVRSARWI